METADLQFFKEKLHEQKDRILHESEATVHDMQTESTLFADPNDRASQETDRITTLRIRDRERKLLGKVQEAIDRVEDGTFGDCEACGEEIGVERLKIRPVTTLCIACKEEQETLEKRGKTLAAA